MNDWDLVGVDREMSGHRVGVITAGRDEDIDRAGEFRQQAESSVAVRRGHARQEQVFTLQRAEDG